MVRLSTMFSFKSKQQQHEPSGWKWEVNHDGVIWNWSHPTTIPPVCTPPVCTPPVSTPPVSTPPISSASLTSASLTQGSNQQKTSLVDYWYIIHDGLAIPWNGEP